MLTYLICKKFNVLPSQVNQESAKDIKKLLLIMKEENKAETKNAKKRRGKKKQMSIGR
jgi:hypothetical protein